MANRRQRIRELQLQLEEIQNTISEFQNELEDEQVDVDEEDYHSEPTFPTTTRRQFSRRQHMRQNPPPSLTLQDNAAPVIDDLVEETGWARTVEDYYFQGDRRGNDTFCYIALFGRVQVPRDFWSLLVGEYRNSPLWKMHIDGWIKRWLRFRYTEHIRNIQTLRWTIMPTKFDALFLPPQGLDAAKYPDGTSTLYLAWADVDMVLFPLCVNENNWLLLQMNLLTNETFVFSSSRRSIKGGLNPILKRWSRVIPTFKESISYFERSGRINTPASTIKFATDVPQGRVEDSGAFVCMFIQKLVQGKPINLEEGVELDQAAMDYRRLMARDLYSYRFSGTGGKLPLRGLILFDPLD